MLVAAERENSAGWRSCALSLRADRRLRLGDQDIAEYDIEAVLRDLVRAETALLAGEPDPVIEGNARTGLAIGYAKLRLYELAVPQFQAAYETTCRPGYPDNGNRAMWLCNLAELNLMWALELYQVGQVAEAEKHTTVAEEHAMRAMTEAPAPRRRCGGSPRRCSRRAPAPTVRTRPVRRRTSPGSWRRCRSTVSNRAPGATAVPTVPRRRAQPVRAAG